jgi:hypothetical protein
MSISVLVELLPDGSGFRARTGEPFNLTATGPTPEVAMTAIDLMLLERVKQGWRVYTLPDPDLPGLADRFGEPEWKLYWRTIMENRQVADVEARRELGWTEPVYKAEAGESPADKEAQSPGPAER